jgi:VanZ family protein
MQPETPAEAPSEEPPQQAVEGPAPSPSDQRRYSSWPLVRAWTPVVLWTGVILGLSSDDFSASETSRIIGPLLAWLFPDTSEETRTYMLFVIRKTAHVTEYGILYLLARRPLRLSSPHWPAWGNALGALSFVLLIASYDEFRQSLSLQRTGVASDVALDFSGGLLALLLSWCFTMAYQRWLQTPSHSSPSSNEQQESYPT